MSAVVVSHLTVGGRLPYDETDGDAHRLTLGFKISDVWSRHFLLAWLRELLGETPKF